MFLLTILSILTEYSLCLILIHKLNSPHVTVLEFPLVILVNDLEFVGQFMGTDLIHLEEVYILGLLVDVEVPHSIYLTS